MRRGRVFIAIASASLFGCGSELAGPSPDGDAAPADVPGAPDAMDTLDTWSAPDIPEAKEVSDSAPGETVADTGPDAAEDTVADSAADTLPDVGPADVTTLWRSELYPPFWRPGMVAGDGAALQDYSYAGYHNGEAALGFGLGLGGVNALERFDVTDFGAVPATGEADSFDNTDAFQAAIDAAHDAGGGVVYVPAGLYRIDSWLEVSSSRIVVKGEGPERSRLWFTRKLGLEAEAHVRFIGTEKVELEVALARSGGRFDNWIAVEDASGVNIGEDVVLGQEITEAFLVAHGMGEAWRTYLGTWQPMLRRTVIGVDRLTAPNRVMLDVPLRAPIEVAHHATMRKVSGLVREVGLEDIGIANAIDWRSAWGGDQINAVTFSHVVDAWVRNVASYVSPGAPASGMGAGAHFQSGGILVASSLRVTIADVHLGPTENRGRGGNGYLFEVRQSSEILTRDSSATGGRNNFIQSRGFGSSGCVWLRVHSSGSAYVPLGPDDDTALPERGEMNTLATANLIDSSTFDDSFDVLNRQALSNGRGHAATECVFWNFSGGEVISLQYGHGYVIGTTPRTRVSTALNLSGAADTAPEDWVEGYAEADTLTPSSLYEDQLQRRLDEIRP